MTAKKTDGTEQGRESRESRAEQSRAEQRRAERGAEKNKAEQYHKRIPQLEVLRRVPVHLVQAVLALEGEARQHLQTHAVEVVLAPAHVADHGLLGLGLRGGFACSGLYQVHI